MFADIFPFGDQMLQAAVPSQLVFSQRLWPAPSSGTKKADTTISWSNLIRSLRNISSQMMLHQRLRESAKLCRLKSQPELPGQQFSGWADYKWASKNIIFWIRGFAGPRSSDKALPDKAMGLLHEARDTWSELADQEQLLRSPYKKGGKEEQRNHWQPRDEAGRANQWK